MEIPPHQVVLVATEGRAGHVIDVVLDEGDFLAHAERFEGRLQEQVAGEVVGHRVPDHAAFGRGVFEMPHVDVEAPAVQEKTAVSGRLLVVAIMQVDRPRLGLLEEVIFHPGWPDVGVGIPLLACSETAVFGFNANDAIHGRTRMVTSEIVCRCSPAWKPSARRRAYDSP